MTPATPWNEMSVAQTPYTKGIVSTQTFTGLMLFGFVPFPMTDAVIIVDPTTVYAEMSLSVATPQTKMSTPLTPWAKVSL